jgi:hypothetical protein
MNYTQLIETISLIVENEKIHNNGLTLTYELPEIEHNSINEAIFRKTNPYSTSFIPSNEYELEIGGILVKFKKLNLVESK